MNRYLELARGIEDGWKLSKSGSTPTHQAEGDDLQGTKENASSKPPVSLEDQRAALDRIPSVYQMAKVRGFLEAFPDNRSATASEIAEALFGRDYTVGNVSDCCQCCHALESVAGHRADDSLIPFSKSPTFLLHE